MSRRCDHIIQRFDAWWKIAYKSLGLLVENVEKDRCLRSIFGNHFHFLLMQALRCDAVIKQALKEAIKQAYKQNIKQASN
jgi:hypothetical protein